jgi:uncharacterized protein (DUF1778 family)
MATVDENKSRNRRGVHLQLDPKTRARVARAAAISGQELSEFAISALSEKADKILERHGRIVLNSDEYEFFLDALSAARKPSKRSSSAARQYRRGRRKGVRHRLAD